MLSTHVRHRSVLAILLIFQALHVNSEANNWSVLPQTADLSIAAEICGPLHNEPSIYHGSEQGKQAFSWPITTNVNGSPITLLVEGVMTKNQTETIKLDITNVAVADSNDGYLKSPTYSDPLLSVMPYPFTDSARSLTVDCDDDAFSERSQRLRF